ncbi:glucose-inhibited division protein A [filamentous cyanobacterium CCP1]|nr:glucose-inhibited division protein A [filamentous cyanobacterium CCP2]PSB54753.1 glucose-inhibited division protein A [filamentous cyanobacterium CCP1]
MDRSKLVAVITGVIALALGIAYLLIVQLLDFRGEMIPAPQDLSYQKFDSQLVYVMRT